MTATVMDGEALAARIKEDLSDRITVLAERGITPGLGTLLVGDDGPSHKYVSMKHADCAELGITSTDIRLPATATQDEVLAAVGLLNADPGVDAFILQYPFPGDLDYDEAVLAVDPHKDADGLHPVNLGRLVMGAEAPLACTPHGIVAMLEAYDVALAGRHVVIVGRGLTIGRPLANLMALKHGPNSAVTVVHTGVSDIGAYTRTADVVVAAAGSPGMITADMIKPGAAVVAAGVSFVDGKVVSDVADDVAEVAAFVSPRIGGVGPMTRAMLLANTVAAAEAGADRSAGTAR
ncbi:bifunctional 5,10-methylenetetrahydrofolate dehydrogenase/5,10-methenyltetrahydrofolate cyclohydrolase [Dermatobacter hominis]|uniref:bifunctional 5,10-methylenetetrahydrofolate dehydrogenase/5,10-methenyltetrahydrofolate cyclohydrolase n=1 Tax=Dermatobacter hominis TaxID=2884263 RepID=UPI001D120A45|nr:tetrahydrofolate dehydrogenase/cyclohydrolase catalytic domain-containing protein [Dermatobacter hominis]UDY37970.1 bifunctional 5,10-methylenetetrahydrofolate dehydrogenase/5,10-methenyltetrahydrofolate cyclohydrolase [Dermatobacter hominis]